MSNDYFQHKAESYEQVNNRVSNVDNIAKAMLNHIPFDNTMKIMDFGSGTGLLLERIAPFVDKVTAVDISKSMNEQLDKKRSKLECELEIIEADLSKSVLDKKFDGIMSSMTLHHVEDIKSIIDKFYLMLSTDGVLAIADLDTEDGSFHTEDTGVFHFGFDRAWLMNIAKEAGFADVEILTASTVNKPYGDYPVFLLIGRK